MNINKLILIYITSFSSIFSFAQCPNGQVEVSINVLTDNWGYETYWELTTSGNSCGNTASIFNGGNPAVGCNANNASSGGYNNNTTISEGPWCLVNGGTYDILSRDGYGDGGAEFIVSIASFPLYTFKAGASSETFSFNVNPPPAIDGSLLNIETPTYVEIGNVEIEGEVENLGSTTINSMDVNYSINSGTTITQTLSLLNISPFTSYNFTHPTMWIPSNSGIFSVDLWISNINGQGNDAVLSNNDLTKTITVKNPIPNIIPSYISSTNSFTFNIIADASDQIDTPRDLDFHPNGDLWIINTGTENGGGSTVKITNPGTSSQNSLWQQDGNAWHFMSLPSGIAFSNNGNFATSTSVYDANHNGGSPFTGPTLWSSDPAIYAQPSGGNGSHIDMLHESPNSMGITSQEKNIFWVYDNYNKDIVMYDFVEDHGPGNDDHSDGRVLRYQGMGLDAINTTITCHLKLDKAKKWLYFVDGGNQRIIRLDINSGVKGTAPSWGPLETLAEYSKMIGFTWEIVVNTGLNEPSGIEIIDNRMIITDHSNGDIVFYDISTMPAVEIGRIQTNEPGIMGAVLGPDGKIWYANHALNKVVMIQPNNIILNLGNNNLEDKDFFYPNPAFDFINIENITTKNGRSKLTIINSIGSIILEKQIKNNSTVDVSSLVPGIYFLNAIDSNQRSFTKKLLIE